MGEVVTCQLCGRETVGRVPKGGDGSQINPSRHRVHPYGVWCSGHKESSVETKL